MANTRIVIEECGHDRIDPSSCVCMDCGIIVGNTHRFIGGVAGDYDDTKFAGRSSHSEQRLFGPHETLGFSQEIIDRAEEISARMTIRDNRGLMKRKRQFACIYYAHLELGYPINPIHIAKQVKINQRDMSPALSEFSQMKTGYVFRGETQTPVEASVSIALHDAYKLGFSDVAQGEIAKIIRDSTSQCGKLQRRNPATIAAGAIDFYSGINGVEYNDGSLMAVNMVSPSTTMSTSNEFFEAFNT